MNCTAEVNCTVVNVTDYRVIKAHCVAGKIVSVSYNICPQLLYHVTLHSGLSLYVAAESAYVHRHARTKNMSVG